MTPRQLAALDFVRDRITRAGFAPTYQEVADHLGVVKSKAHEHVSALVDTGHLLRTANHIRAIALPDMPDLRAVDTALLRAELARRGEVPGALDRPERRAIGRGAVPCAADGCDIQVRYGHAFCLDHFRAISPATQQLLFATHRDAKDSGTQEAAQRYQEAFTQARDEAVTRRRAG